jgi:sterol desaturase/sphingolipid hydroxylase (fatty acid hydroxylase superfamily)
MTLALILSGTFLTINVIGFVCSVWIDRNGLPEHVSAQVANRKEGGLRRRMPLILLNIVMLTVGSFVGTWLVADWFTVGWPGAGVFFAQFMMILLFDDLAFYALHRAMHEVPWLYKTLHSHHHRAYAPVPIEVLHTHPGETGLGAVGMLAGAVAVWGVFGMVSFSAFLSYTVFRHFHELDIHSGLQSRLAHWVPFLAPNEHHDLHHHQPHCGNFASMLTLWDQVFGTFVEDTRVEVREQRRVARADAELEVGLALAAK